MKILNFTRSDIVPQHQDISFEEIELGVFRGGLAQIHRAELIIFRDDDGRANILKNRWAKHAGSPYTGETTLTNEEIIEFAGTLKHQTK